MIITISNSRNKSLYNYMIFNYFNLINHLIGGATQFPLVHLLPEGQSELDLQAGWFLIHSPLLHENPEEHLINAHLSTHFLIESQNYVDLQLHPFVTHVPSTQVNPVLHLTLVHLSAIIGLVSATGFLMHWPKAHLSLILQILFPHFCSFKLHFPFTHCSLELHSLSVLHSGSGSGSSLIISYSQIPSATPK